MNHYSINIHTLIETKAAANEIASKLMKFIGSLDSKSKIIYLSGNLGSGKTTFTRYFIESLGCSDKVKSPTYTLIEYYDIGKLHVYHLDLYRLSAPEECGFLGLDDILSQNNTIMLIEWPEKGDGFLPQPDIIINFYNNIPDNLRSLEIISADW